MSTNTPSPTPIQDGMPPLPEPDAWGGQFHSDRNLRTYGQQCADYGRSVERALWKEAGARLPLTEAQIRRINAEGE